MVDKVTLSKVLHYTKQSKLMYVYLQMPIKPILENYYWDLQVQHEMNNCKKSIMKGR
jgi:hypothetical protein